VSAWLLAAIALIPPLVVAVAMCARGPVGARLVAVQFAAALAVPLLVTLTFALGEASSIDLALSLALLGLPATLLFAVFAERWL
jgi:multisubunit Na+/H+ antiporter MnhF subunit